MASLECEPFTKTMRTSSCGPIKFKRKSMKSSNWPTKFTGPLAFPTGWNFQQDLRNLKPLERTKSGPMPQAVSKEHWTIGAILTGLMRGMEPFMGQKLISIFEMLSEDFGSAALCNSICPFLKNLILSTSLQLERMQDPSCSIERFLVPLSAFLVF